MILTATSAGLLLLGACTSVVITAIVLCGRAAAVGMIITALLYTFTGRLAEFQLGDSNVLFNIAQ